MSTNSSSSASNSSAIHASAFLRTLIAPLIVWGATVMAVTASGQPGVVCITPVAWLMALWCGGQYVRLGGGRPDNLGPALLGAALGLGLGILFILISRQMPVKPEEVSNMQAITAVIVVGGIVVCAALSTFTARATLRRYASDQ